VSKKSKFERINRALLGVNIPETTAEPIIKPIKFDASKLDKKDVTFAVSIALSVAGLYILFDLNLYAGIGGVLAFGVLLYFSIKAYVKKLTGIASCILLPFVLGTFITALATGNYIWALVYVCIVVIGIVTKLLW